MQDDGTQTVTRVVAVDDRATPRLRVLVGSDVGATFELHATVTVIGRDERADWTVAGEGVSRHHAKIVIDGDGVVRILDLGAKNGTFVNGQRADAATLEHGDRIQLGRVVVRFERTHADADAPRTGLDLSPRELEVARLVARGLNNAEIGTVLGISRATVATHLHRAYERLGLSSRAELASHVAAHDED